MFAIHAMSSPTVETVHPRIPAGGTINVEFLFLPQALKAAATRSSSRLPDSHAGEQHGFRKPSQAAAIF